MKKVRVFELAKEFGMRGPDMAKLLREIGFEKVKTHMTALDDADLMMVEARLSAQGLRRQAVSGDSAEAGGLKKKRSLSAAAEDGDGLPVKKALPKKGALKKAAPAAKRELPNAPVLDEPKAPKPAPKRKKLEAAANDAPAPIAKKPDIGAAAIEATPSPAAAPAAEKPAAKTQTKPAPSKPAAATSVASTSAPAAATSSPAPQAVAPTKTETAAPAPEAPAAQTATPAATTPSTPTPATSTPSAPTPAAQKTAAATTKAAPAARQAEPSEPSLQPASKAPAQPAKPAAENPAAKSSVRKLLVPQKKATVLGRIELPQETIRDATRRSAPAAPRDLRRAALQKMQQRGSMRQMGPGNRRGPAMRGGRDARGGTGRRARMATPIDPTKVIEVLEPVSMKALSEGLGIKVNELIATFAFRLKIGGKNINSMLTNDEVELVALELERNIKVVEAKEAMDELIQQLVTESAGQATAERAPVVTFMGHVDHGKTSLMDALRSSDIARGEAGGITQHIGAYKVTNDDGLSVVVLDTPGHAAFTAMRARGADLTDVVVLVVAADDGVMPQTEEAISHAKAANCPIIVAITKCDLPQANPMQVKQQLMVKGLQSEDFGGEIGMIECSSKTLIGLPELIERVHLEAELLDLNARPDAPGKGVVVEARQSAEQGVVVTLLVTDGTLRLKDQIVCGESFSRIRAMIDDHGSNLSEAGPATPITIFGLDSLPSPGDKLFVVENAKKAKEVVEERQRRVRELSRAERSAVTLETLSAKLAERTLKEVKLILKADAMGSLEPVRKCLDDLATSEVRVNVVHSGLGGINKADVDLAATSGAVIVGFNTVADANVRALAVKSGVDIRYYSVIYELLDQVRDAMEGVLAPEEVQSVIGHAEVRALFKSSKFGTIAGCRIIDGVARRGTIVRLSRGGKVIWTGKLASLRREAEDAKEVKTGFECGMTLDGFQDLREEDNLEFVQTTLIKRKLGD